MQEAIMDEAEIVILSDWKQEREREAPHRAPQA
jgi:hypothetical protein